MARPTSNQRRHTGIRPAVFWVGVGVAFGAGVLVGMVWMAFKSADIPVKGGSHEHRQADIVPDAMMNAVTEMTKRHPDRPEGWIQLGNLHFDHDQPTEAIAAYEKALSLDPQNADVWTDLGVMYRRSGQPRRAVEAFDRAVSENPAHVMSRFNKGIVLMHDLADTEAALATWEELLSVDPLFTAPDGQPLDNIVKHYRDHAPRSAENRKQGG